MNYQKFFTVKQSYVEGVRNCQKNAKEGFMKKLSLKNKQTTGRKCQNVQKNYLS